MEATGEGWALRRGLWQDVADDIKADALITDPPYSKTTHDGHDSARRKKGRGDGYEHRTLQYESWNRQQAEVFASRWSEVAGWTVIITDHIHATTYQNMMNAANRYTFAPLPFVAPGSRVRLAGDGPSCWTCWVVVSRPRDRRWSRWGTLPGAYIQNTGMAERNDLVGGKPLWLMRALIRDYTKPGDLIVDPCAGFGTTLMAAVIEGRRAIGVECDHGRFDQAVERLRRGYTPSMF